MIYIMDPAGIPVRYRFLKKETASLFGKWLRPEEEGHTAASVTSPAFEKSDTSEKTGGQAKTPIQLTESLLDQSLAHFPEETSTAYAEFRMLSGLTSRELLEKNACLFHSAAFLYQGKAWLLSAPSGTGKTTQFLNWTRLYPGEISMICGDMPVIALDESGCIRVAPSPWNGKEGFGKNFPNETVPLGGIIYLAQDKENRIQCFRTKKAVIPLLEQFVVNPHTENQIRNLFHLVEAILDHYPVWLLENNGRDESTTLLRKTIKDFITAETAITPITREIDMPGTKPSGSTRSVDTEKRYITRNGIIHASICGRHFLVSSLEARKFCPYMAEINDTSAFLWEKLTESSTVKELIRETEEAYEVEDHDNMETVVKEFIASMEESGYLMEAGNEALSE